MVNGEDNYRIGEEAFFYEIGEIDRVRVLENKSNREFINYKLEILEVLKESEIIVPDRIGDVFECVKRREDSGNIELWGLRDRFIED